MAWIKTVAPSEADERLLGYLQQQQALYPIEYAQPVVLAESRTPADWPAMSASG
jgi:hypothetical protein